MLLTFRKVQAVRRPVTLRDHLVYATTLGHFSLLLNIIILILAAFAIAYFAGKQSVQEGVAQWKADEDRLMVLDNIPDQTSEACYMTLIKRLQTTTDVREDGTVEIAEVVWSEPTQDCGYLGQFR